MIKELKELKKKFGSKRKTNLIEGGDELIAERIANQRPNRELKRQQALKALALDSEIVIQTSNEIKIVPSSTIKKLKLKEEHIKNKDLIPAKLIWPIEKAPKILAISENGKIGILQWEFAGQKPGKIDNLLPAGLENEKIINFIPLPNKKNISIGLISTDGKFKRISIDEFVDMSNRATTILKLKDNVKLKASFICEENGYIFIISNIGRILKFKITQEDMPYMGKLAQGPSMMKLFPDEFIINALSINKNETKDIVLITKSGSFIKHSSQSLRISKKGEIGIMGIKVKNSINKNTKIVDAFINEKYVSLVTNKMRYESLKREEIKSKDYNKEYKINLDPDEFIESVFSLLSP